MISCEVQTRIVKYSEQYIRDHLSGTKLRIWIGSELLIHLDNEHLFTFNFTMMFHQYCTTFTFSTLKNITKHLFIMQHMVIPFPSHVEVLLYTSSPSLSKSSKFLILKFFVKCCKLYLVIKIPSKSHMLDFVLISSVFYKCSYKL